MKATKSIAIDCIGYADTAEHRGPEATWGQGLVAQLLKAKWPKLALPLGAVN